MLNGLDDVVNIHLNIEGYKVIIIIALCPFCILNNKLNGKGGLYIHKSTE